MYPTPVGPPIRARGPMCGAPPALSVGGVASTVIEVHDLHKSHDGQPVPGGLSFAVAAGEIIGIARPNGADKTNTVEIPQGLRSRVRRPATSTCPGSTPATNASDCVRHLVYSCRPHRFRIDCASAKRWACWPSSPATKSTGGRWPLASEPRGAQAVRHAVRQAAALLLALAMVNRPRLLFP